MRLLYCLFTVALMLTVTSPAEGQRHIRSKAKRDSLTTKKVKPRFGKSARVKPENKLSIGRKSLKKSRPQPAARAKASASKRATSKASRPARKVAKRDLSRRNPRRRKGNELLFENAAALRKRLDLIGSAKSEILMSTYIFANDASGNKVAESLAAAARSGVRVHLIVDGQGTKLSPGMKAMLKRAGVEIGVHNKLSIWSLLNLAKAQRRMHDKLLVADGKTLIVGGRNIGNHYFATKGSFIKTDLEVVVAGSAAQSARNYFKKLWDGPLVSGSNKAISFLSKLVAPFRRTMRIGRQTRFASDAPHTTTKIKSEDTTTAQIQRLLSSAVSEVVIRTPYLIPTKDIMRSLQSALKRGVRVRVFTNSFATRDTLLSQLGYEANFQKLAHMGVEIHEFNASATGRMARHEKAIVVDSRHVLIGSHNIDPRSEWHNRETGLVFNDRTMAKQLHMQNSEVRKASSLVAKDGKIIQSGKSRGCGPGCRTLVALTGPLLKITGLVNLL